MKIVFIDPPDIHYTPDALESAPLGGSQSALLVVAEELARTGMDVTVAARHFPHRVTHRGVQCLNLSRAREERMPDADVAVTVNRVLPEEEIRALFTRAPRLLHWHKNDVLSPYGKQFADTSFYSHIDQFVFCSHFQANGFLRTHGLPSHQVTVIPNPIAPAFCNLFGADEAILPQKDPDLLVYASAPNRGLAALLDTLWPKLLQRRPGLRLEVYSGFYLDQGVGYREGGEDLTAAVRQRLEKWVSLPRVTLSRGVPKPELARRLRAAAMLCYPCQFRETSCHIALEAMAAGCLVSTTTIGALPETTAGFARLTQYNPPAGFSAREFIRNTLEVLSARDDEPQETERNLRRQVEHVNAAHAPAAIARLWSHLLGSSRHMDRAHGATTAVCRVK
jgi:glycosyltransferase involved in cell wall biosynthesis